MSSDRPPDTPPYDVPLGAPEATYHSHTLPSRNLVALGVALIVSSAIPLLTEDLVEAETNTLVVLAGIAVVLVAAGACSLAFRLVFRIHLSVYENGVLVETTFSSEFARWDEVEAVFEHEPRPEPSPIDPNPETYRCGFSRADGRAFWFRASRVSGLRDFAARLHARIDDRIRAEARRALAAGEVAWFGPVGISCEGVHSRKGVLPWSEVSFAGVVRNTDFDVLKRGSNWGWFSQSLDKIENVTVLTELIKSRKEWPPAGAP
jgi:hypothetical protein